MDKENHHHHCSPARSCEILPSLASFSNAPITRVSQNCHFSSPCFSSLFPTTSSDYCFRYSERERYIYTYKCISQTLVLFSIRMQFLRGILDHTSFSMIFPRRFSLSLCQKCAYMYMLSLLLRQKILRSRRKDGKRALLKFSYLAVGILSYMYITET